MTTITQPGQRDGGGGVLRVVIAGAGLAGLAAVRRLARAGIRAGLAAVRRLARAGIRATLVDRNVYATFQPLLYQLATGGLASGDVAYPVRAISRRYGRRSDDSTGRILGSLAMGTLWGGLRWASAVICSVSDRVADHPQGP
jgi:hypothetical protein